MTRDPTQPGLPIGLTAAEMDPELPGQIDPQELEATLAQMSQMAGFPGAEPEHAPVRLPIVEIPADASLEVQSSTSVVPAQPVHALVLLYHTVTMQRWQVVLWFGDAEAKSCIVGTPARCTPPPTVQTDRAAGTRFGPSWSDQGLEARVMIAEPFLLDGEVQNPDPAGSLPVLCFSGGLEVVRRCAAGVWAWRSDFPEQSQGCDGGGGCGGGRNSKRCQMAAHND